ncbi:MAG: hypothetical protein KF819_09855 [Labilithrix sp.]|nr:hypothetical protein [Labilithrix sp.]
MLRSRGVFVRVALLSALFVPCAAYADALPPDPQDIYYHCTPAEQCPSGSETCATLRGPAGQTRPDADCAARATEKNLEQRCAGKGGYLYCPSGATGTWTAPTAKPAVASSSTSRKGCW